MELTKFEDLRRAIEKLGANQGIARLAEQLNSGKQDFDPKNVVFGDDGIYYLDEQGILTKILVHIVDKNMGEHVLYENLNDSDFVSQLHKYHFTNCGTIQRADNEGWRDKYKMSRKSDGTFYYRFINNFKVLQENESQRLEPCLNCLRKINSRLLFGNRYTKKNFKPSIIFSDEMRNHWLPKREYADAICSVPNMYQRDWKKISKEYKARQNYQCEGENCQHRDLSDKDLQKFLHCHHVDFDKTHNHFSNLKALCIRCHAQQARHGHLKKHPHYKKYTQLLKTSVMA